MNYLQDTSISGIAESGSQLGAGSGVVWGAMPAVALGLMLFGLIYNALIHAMHRHGWNEGYVWLEVVIGVAVTLVAASFVVGWEVAAVLFILFAASGLAPAAGDMYRYARARRAETRRNRE